MRYFKLSQDRDIPGGVSLSGVNSIGGYHEARSGDLSMLDNAFVSHVDYNSLNSCPDILDLDLFMVKGAVKQVFDMYIPKSQYKHCILTERDGKKHEQYFIPLLDLVDVGEGLEAAAQDKQIFRIISSNERMVVVSLEVIEAVLRRSPMGVRVDVIDSDNIAQGRSVR